MSQKKKITLSLNEETLDRLDEVAKTIYRDVDRTKAIRWLIDDRWEEMKKGQAEWKGAIAQLGSIPK